MLSLQPPIRHNKRCREYGKSLMWRVRAMRLFYCHSRMAYCLLYLSLVVIDDMFCLLAHIYSMPFTSQDYYNCLFLWYDLLRVTRQYVDFYAWAIQIDNKLIKNYNEELHKQTFANFAKHHLSRTRRHHSPSSSSTFTVWTSRLYRLSFMI